MNQLIIGRGEVGSALQKVLECPAWDTSDNRSIESDKPDVLHIAFGWSTEFEKEVMQYVDSLGPNLVIVHSTVPRGTCDPHGWVHSPIRGVHPNLEQGIRTFVKFFGGEQANIASAIFQEKGIKTAVCPKAADTEALKLFDTTYYGWNILFEKVVHAYCEKHGLDFSTVYTYANASYNSGYASLGRYDVARPVLKHYPGPIGGHCVLPNLELLDDEIAILMKDLHTRMLDIG